MVSVWDADWPGLGTSETEMYADLTLVIKLAGKDGRSINNHVWIHEKCIRGLAGEDWDRGMENNC